METPVVLLIILIAVKISTAPLVAFRATWESITVLVVRKEGEDAQLVMTAAQKTNTTSAQLISIARLLHRRPCKII